MYRIKGFLILNTCHVPREWLWYPFGLEGLFSLGAYSVSSSIKSIQYQNKMYRISVLHYKNVPLLSLYQWLLRDMAVASVAFWKFVGIFLVVKMIGRSYWHLVGEDLGRQTSCSLQGSTVWWILLHFTWFLNVLPAIHVAEKPIYN